MRKRNINFLPIILFILIIGIIASSIVYLYIGAGNTQTLYIPQEQTEYDEDKVTIEHGTFGVAKPLSIYQSKGCLAIDFEIIIKGPVDTTLKIILPSKDGINVDELNLNMSVNRLGIIRNDTYKTFAGMKFVLAAISLDFILIGIYTLYVYYQRTKRNSCSYKTELDLISGILLFAFALATGLCAIAYHYEPEQYSMVLFGALLASKLRISCAIVTIIAVVFGLIITSANAKKGIPYILINALCAAEAITLPSQMSNRTVLIELGALGIAMLISSITISVSICTILASKHTTKNDKDYILLFSQFKNEETEVCIDRAIELHNAQNYRNKKQEAYFIACGKKADKIKQSLLDKGINEELIIIEDKSTDIEDSLIKTRTLVSKRHAGAKAAFVVPDYKVFDTGNTASNLRLSIEAIGAKTNQKNVYNEIPNNLKDLLIGMPANTILLAIASAIIPILMYLI